MADQVKKNREQSGVAENPIAEVFEGRHPSESEKRWAEGTLAKTLEKAPERAIGDPTGVNLDEHGNARFTTLSNVPIRRLDRKSTRLNSSHTVISYAVFCLKKKKSERNATY